MPGSARLRDCEVLRKITTKQADEKRFYGAICAAPAVTLNSWGLLRRKQTIVQIRTVVAFVGESRALQAYSASIRVSQRTGYKTGFAKGMGLGATYFMVFCCYALLLWYGGYIFYGIILQIYDSSTF